MVKTIIACSDIHFKSLKGIDDLNEVLEVFYNQCREIVKENGGSEFVRIAVAGDIFDQKITITNESIMAVAQFLKTLGEIAPTVVIIGNHDFLVNNSDRVDSLTPLFKIGDLKNVTYLDMELGYKSGYYVDDNIVWTVYSHFTNFKSPDIDEAKRKYPQGQYTYVGLIHADINGAKTDLNRETNTGLDAKMFNNIDFVIAGHIHKRQNVNEEGYTPVVYCSSIKQKDMGETVHSHGFVKWDVEKKAYEFVDTPNVNGGFYKIEINSIDDFENEDYIVANI